MKISKVVTSLIIAYLIFIVLQYVVNEVEQAKNASNEMVCHSKFDGLRVCILLYLEDNHMFPEFKDNEGQETWSWRTIMPLYCGDDDFRNNVNLNLPWQAESNHKLLENSSENGYINHLQSWYSCRYIEQNNHKAAQVAIKGDGTLWTEVNKNPTILNQKELIKDKIIAIEIANPTNEWYEPGDDVSPDVVLDMYRKYRDKKYQTPHKRIFFLTIEGTEEFANIKTETEMLSRLYIWCRQEYP